MISDESYQPISVALLLPSKYSGYIYLVDQLNRVRWRACGKSKPDEIKTMISCAEDLLRYGGGDVPVLSPPKKTKKKDVS